MPHERGVVRRVPEADDDPRGAAQPAARELTERSPRGARLGRATRGGKWTSGFRKRHDPGSTAWRSRPRASGRWFSGGIASGWRRTPVSPPVIRRPTTRRSAPRSRTAATRCSPARRSWPRCSRPIRRSSSRARGGPGGLRILGPAGCTT